MSLKFITLPKASRGFLNVGTGEGVEVIIIKQLKGKLSKKSIKGNISLITKISGKIAKKSIKGVMSGN